MNESYEVQGNDVPDVISKEPQLGIAPPNFVRIEKYSSFVAEVAIIDDDFVFHFFLPKSGVADYVGYWEGSFPECLDEVARNYFKVSYPRLKAAHIKELGIDSWWMRAYGFAGNTLNPEGFVEKFYEKLHESLSDALRNLKRT